MSNPLEQQYGLLDAALIGAGSSANNALNQIKTGYYTARRNYGDAFGNPATIIEYQAKLDEIKRARAEESKLYQPLTRAYPMATAIGESLPGLLYGWRAWLPALDASLNDRILRDAFEAAGKQPVTLRGLLNP